MKAVKITTALGFIILLNVILQMNVFGQNKVEPNQTQNTENANQNKQADKKTNLADKGEGVAEDKSPYKNKANERYRIGFQDLLEVQIIRHPELTQVVSVGSDGTILMPRIDQPILAVCKTERELAETVRTLYSTYLRNPFVNVRVADQKSQAFAVMGAVQKPGNFYLNQRVRLLQLLALAGGQDVETAGSKIQIARTGNLVGCSEDNEVTSEDDEVKFISYNLNDVLEGKENPWMQPGDIVSVLVADEAYVVGNVFKPAKVSLKEPVTLTQAIAIAGGLDATAQTNKVIIQRQESGSSAKIEMKFDIKDIREKKIPDPQLQANDIVEVTNDKFKSVRNGLVKALLGGVPNLFYKFP
ncbi:MAG: SLBB domain-containing protein [Acidobacteria bacterium]|nr:SLBB domain-containing protein [Acidobacteriota bacterium]